MSDRKLSLFKINDFKRILRDEPDLVLVTPDLDIYAELRLSEIPEDRLGYLNGLCKAAPDKCLFLERSLYQALKEEDEELTKGGDTIGQDSHP